MLKTLTRITTGSLLVAALSVSAVTASAASSPSLQPYQARYTLDWASGVSFSGDAIRSLQKDGDNWVLETNASAMFASLSERSSFTLSPQIQPQRYNFKRKVLGKKRTAQLDFDWQSGQVTNNVNDKPWKMAVTPGVLDKLSVQLQLRLDVKAGKEKLEYQVADGGKMKTYRFVVEGKESITTPAGTFEAIKISRDRGANSSRKTWIWLAPELDYLIVKIHQKEKADKEYKLVLKTVER